MITKSRKQILPAPWRRSYIRASETRRTPHRAKSSFTTAVLTIVRSMTNWLCKRGLAMRLFRKGHLPPVHRVPANCHATTLPSGDGIGPTGWYDTFEANINPMFVGTPEEPERGYCAGGGCHTVVDAGGDLDFLPPSDPCSARWNFLVSQAFIDINNRTASPLLRQPLGEPTLDPNVSTHGGQEVFKGQDDNYQLLRAWITDI